MLEWLSVFQYNPIPALLQSGNKTVAFFAARDLLDEADKDPSTLWDLAEASKIVRRQAESGAWEYPGGNPKIRSKENYDQIETFRNLGFLIESYGFNNQNPAISKAVNYLFSFQTGGGDIRGILGNQYTPYYTAAMLELMIKSGFAADDRVLRAFGWLESMRQDDGGWAIPLRTVNRKLDVICMESETLEPDRSMPFSHMVTGIVLRAFAAHEYYRYTPVAMTAGNLLLNNLFKKDNYTDRGTSEYWLKFTYPFWFTDLISATDSLSKLGFDRNEAQMAKAIDWFLLNQNKSGLWSLVTLKNKSQYQTELWLSLAICRIIKRLYHQESNMPLQEY